MKYIIFLAVVASTVALPQSYEAPAARSSAPSSSERVAILRDDRVQPEEGSYSFDFESADGTSRSEAGQNENEAGAVVQAGQVSYYLPDGTLFELKFVADENGFQPQSDFLPIAPVNPHPIPAFVQEQIDRAAREQQASLKSVSNNSGERYYQ